MRTLPPLPPAMRDYPEPGEATYTAEDMRAYARQVLEAAAQEIRDACAYTDWNEDGRAVAEQLVPRA